MPVKHPLLVTCAVVALTVAVRTHAIPTTAHAASEQAPLLLDGLRPAAPRSVDPALPPMPTQTRSAAAPFVLTAPKPAWTAATPGADAAARPAEIDLSALRYFAAQNDLGRVSAEIRLLRAKHPDWEPPSDLFSDVGGGPEEQPLWDFFARHDLGGLHARMDALHRDMPDWQPSAGLAAKLALAEAHDALVAASDAQRWGTVVDIAVASPALLTCADLDALWRTAEALARSGDEVRALAAYRYVLASCPSAEARLATVQKASALLTAPDALAELVQMGLRAPDGRGEFDQVRLDLMRRRVGAAAANPAAPPVPPQDLAALSASAAAPGGQDDAQLLGWYARSHKDYAGAERWFRTALAAGQSPKAAEGLVLTLRDGGNAAEARALALRYADLDPLNRKLMVELQSAALADDKAAPTADEVASLARAVDDLRSADGAQALGWHAFKTADLSGAEGWFRKSAEWKPNESAAIGLVVVARRLHHDRDYAARVAQYRSVYPRVAELEALMRSKPGARAAGRMVAEGRHGTARLQHVARAGQRKAGAPHGDWDSSADEIVKTYNAGQYDTAVALLEQRRQKRTEPHGLSVVRGWAMYHRGDWEGAKRVFSSLDGGGFSQERQEGLRVIEQGYTNPRFR